MAVVVRCRCTAPRLAVLLGTWSEKEKSKSGVSLSALSALSLSISNESFTLCQMNNEQFNEMIIFERFLFHEYAYLQYKFLKISVNQISHRFYMRILINFVYFDSNFLADILLEVVCVLFLKYFKDNILKTIHFTCI